MEETKQSFDPELIQLVRRQTKYTEEEIVSKLIKHNGNHIDVIREYLGVKKQQPKPIVSVNQEIYRQIRNKMFELDKLKEEDLKKSKQPPI